MTDTDLESLRWAAALGPLCTVPTPHLLYLLDRHALRRVEVAYTDAALADAQKRLDEQKELNRALADRLAELEAPPAGTYACGCPARWAERKVNCFCDTHYRPLPMERP